eukprot:2420406-Rhodomonas_salina.1
MPPTAETIPVPPKLKKREPPRVDTDCPPVFARDTSSVGLSCATHPLGTREFDAGQFFSPAALERYLGGGGSAKDIANGSSSTLKSRRSTSLGGDSDANGVVDQEDASLLYAAEAVGAADQ